MNIKGRVLKFMQHPHDTIFKLYPISFFTNFIMQSILKWIRFQGVKIKISILPTTLKIKTPFKIFNLSNCNYYYFGRKMYNRFHMPLLQTLPSTSEFGKREILCDFWRQYFCICHKTISNFLYLKKRISRKSLNAKSKYKVKKLKFIAIFGNSEIKVKLN